MNNRRYGLILICFAAQAAQAAQVAQAAQAAEVVSPSHPGLRDELLELRRADQEARTSDTVAASEIAKVDTRNTLRLKEIIAEYGWPTNSMVGEDGAFAAWTLAQHADQDPNFQRSVLGMIKELLPHGEARPSNYAYLFDRIHRPQRYGTQGACSAPGKWEPREIEDPANVDERRASMSINPQRLTEYIDLVSELCN